MVTHQTGILSRRITIRPTEKEAIPNAPEVSTSPDRLTAASLGRYRNANPSLPNIRAAPNSDHSTFRGKPGNAHTRDQQDIDLNKMEKVEEVEAYPGAPNERLWESKKWV